MEREAVDQLFGELQRAVGASKGAAFLPLDVAVRMATQQTARGSMREREFEKGWSDLLTLLDVTSVSAGLAIKQLATRGDDSTGIRDALVDLWGRAEAARCLWLDAQDMFEGAEARERIADLWETARLLAPDAIAVAMRLSEPVAQYVEFASKVVTVAAAPRA